MYEPAATFSELILEQDLRRLVADNKRLRKGIAEEIAKQLGEGGFIGKGIAKRLQAVLDGK